MVVHDHAKVRERLCRDLAARFGTHYDVRSEASPAEALALLERLAVTEAPAALIFAGDTVGGAPGAEMLVRARELDAHVRRVLLVGRGEWNTAHPAVEALTVGKIDSYVFVPWAPLERWLYLPVTEFLADWEATRPAPLEVVRVVASRSDARAHELRDTFARIAIPFGFYDADSDAGASILARAGVDAARLPVVVFRSGRALVQPTDAELAAVLGFDSSPTASSYDLVVVGAGPAGLAAAVYGASEGLRTLVVEPHMLGGQAGMSARIRNYLGFPNGVAGFDLANRALEQAWFFGTEVVLAQAVVSLREHDGETRVALSEGTEVAARAVVVATGLEWRRLGVPALEAFRGAGVFYGAAAAEARALAGRDVYIVGAGNSAGQAAVYLARWARSVTLLARGARVAETMSAYLARQLELTRTVAVRVNTEVVDAHGGGQLAGLTLRNRLTGATDEVEAAAVFVMIGAQPRTEWLDGALARDDRGYILTGADVADAETAAAAWSVDRRPMLLEASMPGVFAAGDVRHGSVKRVASAVGEGAIAVQLVHRHLAGSA